MTTVINNPNNPNGNSESSGASGVVIGAVIVVLILIGVIIFALPYIRERVDSMSQPANPTINIELPTPPITVTPTTPAE